MAKRLLRVERRSEAAFPDEILGYMLLLACGAQPLSLKECGALLALRATSVQFRAVVDALVVPHIRELGHTATRVFAQSGALLAFTGLRRLRVGRECFDTQCLARALDSLSALQDLCVWADDGDALQIAPTQLCALRHLTVLTLWGCTEVDDAAFHGLTRLTSLNLAFCDRLSEAALTGLSALNTLVLGDNMHGVKNLSALTALTRLSWKRSGSPPALVQTLSDLTNLTQLHRHDGFNANDEIWLGRLTSLHHLSLEGLSGRVAATDDCLRGLTALRTLRLCVRDDGLTADALSHLTNLEALCIQDGGLAARVLTEDSVAPLIPKLTFLAVENYDPPSGMVLARLGNLTYLDLCDRFSYRNPAGHGVRDCDLTALVNLRTLVLSRTRAVYGRDSFAYLTALTALDLRNNTVVRDSALPLLPQLRRLDLCCNTVIHGEALTALTNLSELVLVDNKDVKVAALLKLPALRRVVLNEARCGKPPWSRLSDAGIECVTGIVTGWKRHFNAVLEPWKTFDVSEERRYI